MHTKTIQTAISGKLKARDAIRNGHYQYYVLLEATVDNRTISDQTFFGYPIGGLNICQYSNILAKTAVPSSKS